MRVVSWVSAVLFFVSLPAFAGFGLTNTGNSSSKVAISNPGNISPKVLEMGLKAYQCAIKKGVAKRNDVLTIIDYSKPSNQKRMWVLDMHKNKVDSEQYVAHGSGSGGKKATKFSNLNNSHQSSIGVFVTEETYHGKNGYSLRMKGLENGVNDKARSRAIVIHGANYVNDNFIKKYGRAGRSWGCPALDANLAKPTINKIKDGSVVFAYYPDRKWLKESNYLNC